MKRYLVFSGDEYYPTGGWDDYTSEHDTADEARAAVEEAEHGKNYRWAHIADTQTGQVRHWWHDEWTTNERPPYQFGS